MTKDKSQAKRLNPAVPSSTFEALSGSNTTPWYKLYSSLLAPLASLQYPTAVSLYMDFKKSNMSVSDWVHHTKMLQNETKQVTQKDYLAALTLAITESPLFALEHIKTLTKMAASESRREAESAIEILTDAFSSDMILPDTETASSVYEQAPLKAFVAEARSLYVDLLKLLELHSQDQLEHGRVLACRCLSSLLAISFHRQSVLSLLVNKLGDPSRKLASRCAFYMESKAIAVDPKSTLSAIETAITRSMNAVSAAGNLANIDVKKLSEKQIKDQHKSMLPHLRTIYYAMAFLVTVRLKREQPNVTRDILAIYALLFNHFVIKPATDQINTAKEKPKLKKSKKGKEPSAKKSKEDSPPISLSPSSLEFQRIGKLLLTGLSRAIPFARNDNHLQFIEKYTEPLKKLAESDSMAIACHSLTILRSLGQIKYCLETLQSILAKHQTRVYQQSSCQPMIYSLLYKLLVLDKAGTQETTCALLKNLFSLLACGLIGHPNLALGLLHACIQPPNISIQGSLLKLPDEDASLQSACLWELVPITKHYMLSISNGAEQLCNLQPFTEPNASTPAELLQALKVLVKPENASSDYDFVDLFAESAVKPVEASKRKENGDEDDDEFSDLGFKDDDEVEDIASDFGDLESVLGSDSDLDEKDSESDAPSGAVFVDASSFKKRTKSSKRK